MATLKPITSKTSKLKKSLPPGKKWKMLFLISLIVNILCLTTILYTLFKGYE